MSGRRPFYGWWIVLVGAMAAFASAPGQSYGFSVFIDAFIADTGFTRTEISALYTVGTGISAVMVMVIGQLADRYGPRTMLLAVATALGLVCFGIAFAVGPIAFFLAFAALRALGQGSLPVNGTLLVAQWFMKYRGRAMAVMGLGAAASTAVFPSLAQFLIDEFGWRNAYMIVGVMVWVLIIPVGILVARNRPEDKNLYPDGASTPPVSEQATERDANAVPEKSPRRTLFFWTFALAIASTSLVSTALIFHQISIMTEFGLTAELAAAIFIPFSIATASSSLVGGWLVDRFGPKRVFIGNMGLLLVTILILLTVSNPALAVVYSVLHGVYQGVQAIIWNTVWAYYYGRNGLGQVQGTGHMVMIAGSAVGPLPLAALQGYFDSFVPGIALIGLLPVAAAISVSLINKKPYGAA